MFSGCVYGVWYAAPALEKNLLTEAGVSTDHVSHVTLRAWVLDGTHADLSVCKGLKGFLWANFGAYRYVSRTHVLVHAKMRQGCQFF